MPAVTLTADALDDQDQLGFVIDRVLLRDAEYRRLSRRVVRQQRKLKKLCRSEAWRRYLRVEAETSARHVHVLDLVARWAFDQGVQAGRAEVSE